MSQQLVTAKWKIPLHCYTGAPAAKVRPSMPWICREIHSGRAHHRPGTLCIPPHQGSQLLSVMNEYLILLIESLGKLSEKEGLI